MLEDEGARLKAQSFRSNVQGEKVQGSMFNVEGAKFKLQRRSIFS